jgi:hypothetical protein
MKTLKIGKKRVIVTDENTVDKILRHIAYMKADISTEIVFLEINKSRIVKDDKFLDLEIERRINYLKEAYEEGENLNKLLRGL